MIIKRAITDKLLVLAQQYPVVTITGPRQSGKTTLCKHVFPKKPYVSLESIECRNAARENPQAFLDQFPQGAIIDEIQHVPGLTSAIQVRVDEVKQNGLFIITGSCNFSVLNVTSQSLAGRTAILHLLPFTYDEISGHAMCPKDLDTLLYTGFYPRIFDQKLPATEALSFYTTSYIERDVRMLLNIHNIDKFTLFLKLCAARTGSIVNLSSLGKECGVKHNTVKSWLAILQASYIITLLRPHHRNFKKRLIKSPKLYFIDVGLACYLLEIFSPVALKKHSLRGALFETFIISELIKHRFNAAQPNNLYYFRDNVGNEIDILLDHGTHIIPVEIKSSGRITVDSCKGLDYYRKLNPTGAVSPSLVYSGEQTYDYHDYRILSYSDIACLQK
jgi:predicted AAA+ superfamily ATPase